MLFTSLVSRLIDSAIYMSKSSKVSLLVTFYLSSMKGKYIFKIAYLKFLICLFSSITFTQIIGTNNIFTNYRQFVWQDQHGLPQNGISKIVKTPDGYLWLAIAEGVVRFDGVKFTAFDTGNTPEIRSNNVQSLLLARDETLWIGTYGGGITSLKNGVFQNFSVEQGLSDAHVKCLFQDSKGNLWIGTDGGGLNNFRDGKFTVISEKDGLPDKYIHAIAEDSDGNIWVGSAKGLTRIANEKFTVFRTADGLAGNSVNTLFRDRENRLWIGGTDGLSILDERKFKVFGETEGIKRTEIQTIAQDRDGTMFFGTAEDGLYRKIDEKFESVETDGGLVNNNIQSIFADINGDIWLGTSGGGLAQLHLGKFKTYNVSDGLKGEMAGAVYADSSGAVWIGTDEGLSRFKDNKFIEIKMPDGKPLRNVSQIVQDGIGNFWLSANDREIGGMVFRFNEATEKIEIIPHESFSHASIVMPDRKGNIWFGTGFDGLHFIGANGSNRHFRKTDGLADEYITDIFEDRSGTIWIGTRNGLSRLEGDKFKTFSAAENINAKHILTFHEDSHGNLWIGTHGEGLYRFRDGKFNVVTIRDGLYDNLAFRILEDGRGNLWMSGNKGIYRAEIAGIEDFFNGQRSAIESFSYGASDGMLSRECNGASPAGTKTSDGKLWFPTIKGVVVVDPNQSDLQPPSVMIENVSIDKLITPFDDFVEIQPEQENLEIGFSAISWNRPQQIRFRYKLEGLDTNWTEAGTRRTAYFPHIAAGNYTFRVIADNGEGIWNETGKSLRIRVLPPFYKTWWFFVLCALVVALLIRLVYSYRLHQLEKINEVRTVFTRQLIEYQEAERKRIAVELHDSIGQSLIVIRNRALMGLSAPEKNERMIAQLEEISDSAADSINEVRQIAHNLHPYQLEHLGLKTALETMLEKASETSTIKFSTEIDDVDDTLSKETEISFYRVVQESLNNILKHSEASEAEIKILRNNGNINLLIRDNGKGFEDVEIAKNKRGLGLAGITERAKMMNALCDIHSAEGKGTTVSLMLNVEK